MRVYHFLSADHARNDIELQRIKIARISDLNDPFELMAGVLADKKVRRAVQNLKSHWNGTMGLICFSKDWRNPVVWSHYASKHTGVGLGFEISDEFAIPIQYVESRLEASISHEDASVEIKKQYIKDLVSTKYMHWRYEEEVRMYIGLDEGTKIDELYFYPFDAHLALREVILGATCQLNIDDVRELVNRNYKDVNVFKARMGFHKFNIVADRRSLIRK